MRNIVNIFIATGILVGGLSVAYYFVYHLPRLESQRLELEKQKYTYEKSVEISNNSSRSECLIKIDNAFAKLTTEGISDKQVLFLIEERDKRKNDCYKEYPVK